MKTITTFFVKKTLFFFGNLRLVNIFALPIENKTIGNAQNKAD